MKHIAVFQYHWPLQIHTVNLVAALAAAGDNVDLFIDGCRTDLVDLSRLKDLPQVRLFNITRITGEGWKKIVRRIYGALEGIVKRFSFAPLILPAVIAARHRMREERYDYFIGVEKMGMIWAGFMSRLTGAPFVYYSLELYDEDHPGYAGRSGFPALRRLEKKCHRKAAATIIQDRLRGEHLFRSNGIVDGRMIFLPVSVPGLPVADRSGSFRTQWKGKPELPVVLYLGLFEEARYCFDVAAIARNYGDKFRVVFHGYGDAEVIDRICKTGEGTVVLSTELVPEDRLPDVVASADIGLALYQSYCANDLLTAFSSEKIALYCRMGLPFIAFETESYRELVTNFRCCVLIKEIGELPRAVELILDNYSVYSAAAIEAFRTYYDFDANVTVVIKDLDNIFGKSPTG